MKDARRKMAMGLVLAGVVLGGMARVGFGYVDGAPGLAELVNEAQGISLVEVTAFDNAKHTLTLKQVRALKGELSPGEIEQQLGAMAPTSLGQWAAPGARAVLFSTKTIQLVCMGGAWYSMSQMNGTWVKGKARPDLPLAYCGTVSRLAEAVERLAAGRDAVITVVSYGADDAGTAFDLAFHRSDLPGLARLDRVRMTPAMLGSVGRVSSMAGYLVGAGPVDEGDLPGLLEKLSSGDAMARKEAAQDIGWIKKSKAQGAVKGLTGLLKDPELSVRLAAAAAVLRIAPETRGAVDVLAAGLASTNAFERRDAVRSVGMAGPAGGELAERLVVLLKDGDAATRRAALAAIATLGPAAAGAAPAVRGLLDDAELQCDAADALGRMGRLAQPVPESMIRMLSSAENDTQWAAVRAMSQIGGKQAHAAVDFMIKKVPTATMTEGYNMRIYLAMLGPGAVDALPALASPQLRNGKLSNASEWAIEPDRNLPWDVDPGIAGGPGGPKVIYTAYINNLGERLAPAARLLAGRMMAGNPGIVPVWGYRLLGCGAPGAMAIFVPHLGDEELAMRERAAVGLGYMGAAAAGAKAPLTAALQKATDEREKRLLEWAIRQLEREEE